MTLDDDIHASEIAATLESILASPVLGEGSRRRQLLRFLVEEELAGRGDRLKAYTVATSVFGRDDDFDPGRDNIVRVEANRLRQALDTYALAHGQNDTVVIDIPKGGYRPHFHRRIVSTKKPRSSRPNRLTIAKSAFVGVVLIVASCWFFWWNTSPLAPPMAEFEGPRILVDRFRSVGSGQINERLAVGLVSELVNDLSQYHWLSISQWTGDGSAMDGLARHATATPDYLLTGETALDGSSWQVTARLQTLSDLEVVWTGIERVQLDPQDIDRGEQAIARQIADRIGSAEGIVPTLLRADHSPLDEIELKAFDCVLGLHVYWQESTVETHQALRDCLEETTQISPQYAEAWAALVFVYIDEQRHGRNPRSGANSWMDAERAVDKARALAPLSSLVLNAAMTLAIERPDRDLALFRSLGAREFELRPNNPLTLANYGMKLAINAGDFAQGLALVERAFELSPSAPEWYSYTPAFIAVMGEDDTALLQATRALTSNNAFTSLILRVIAHARGGDFDSLLNDLEHLDALGVTNAEAAIAYVTNRRFAPQLEAALINQLETAYQTGKR